MAGLHKGSQRKGRLFQLCIKTRSEEMAQVALSASNMEQSSATDEDFTAPCDLNQTHLGHHFPMSFLPSRPSASSSVRALLLWQTRYSSVGISCEWHTLPKNVMGSTPDGKKHSLFQRKKRNGLERPQKDLGARQWELIEHLWEKEGHLSQLLFSSAKWFYWWVTKGFSPTFSLKEVL